MDYDTAIAHAKKTGEHVAADYYGSGWSVGFENNELWDINPHTGTRLLHRPSDEHRKATWSVSELYEYAGFKFVIRMDDEGYLVQCSALEQQHPAANKDKHRRAAIECFYEDFPKRRRLN